MKKFWIFGILGVLGFFFLVFLVFALSMVRNYNSLITMSEEVDQAWAQVENQYQRRLDLIPNLVNTVRGYANQEQEIFTQIAEARSRIGSAQTPKDRMVAEDQMGGFLSRLLMISENYPQLKSNENFMNLQAQLEGTENRISVERMRFNETVKAYNLYIKQFPRRMYASLLGFQPKDYYEAEAGAERAPTVDFSN